MKVCKVATSCIKYCFDWTINWKLFLKKVWNEFIFFPIHYEIWSGDWVYIQIQKQASYYNFSHRLSIIVALNSWSSIGVMSGLLCRLSTLDWYQGIYLLSLTSLLSFFFQRCPLSQLILRVKLFDIGPPKAILNLALQPPDTDDIERTILLLKQVWDWFYHTIILGLPTVSRISTSCRLGFPDLNTPSIVICYEVGRV